MVNSISGYGITSTSQLYDLADKLGLKLNYVGFAENLHTMIPKNGIYIINLGNNQIFGTHWTVLIINGNNAFYSDSYGAPPEDEIFDFVKKKKTRSQNGTSQERSAVHIKLDYNKDIQLQAIDENYCGIWALLTSYYLIKKKGTLAERFNQFASNFTDLS